MAEELVGEIADEHDPDIDADVVTRDGDGWLMPAMCISTRSNARSTTTCPSGDHETLAGLVIAEFGGLPDVGDTVAIDAATPIPPSWSHDAAAPHAHLARRSPRDR